MTTSHRPQLEARSGAKNGSGSYVPTGIQHARLLPGHTKIKYRENISGDGRDLLESQLQKEVDDHEGDGSQDFEEESDEDQEALLQELNKIRAERMVAKIRQERQEAPSGTLDVSSRGASSKIKSWRNSATFGRNRVAKPVEKELSPIAKDKNATGYTNNMVKSKYHQEFLHKYVK